MAEGIYQELVDIVSKIQPDAGLVDAFVLIWGDYSVDHQVRWDKRGAPNLRNDLILNLAANLLAAWEKTQGDHQEAFAIFKGELLKKMPVARKSLEEAQDVE